MSDTGIRQIRMRSGLELDQGDNGMRVTGLPGWEEWTFTVAPGTDERGAAVSVEAPVGVEIDTDRWRRVPIGTILATARTARSAPAMAAATRALGVPPKRPHGGSELHRSWVVEVYRLAIANGWSPRDAIASCWRLRDEKTASVWIKECRDHGLLGTFAEERARASQDRDKRTKRNRGKGSTPARDAWGTVPKVEVAE